MLSRRGFLGGLLASAAVAPALAAIEPAVVEAPLFSGAIGEYRGVIIREVVDLRSEARRALAHWHKKQFEKQFVAIYRTELAPELRHGRR